MNKLFIAILLLSIVACGNKGADYRSQENETFLAEIAQHAKASITDITELKRQPTNTFIISTRCRLPDDLVETYHTNNGSIINTDDDIWDIATYTIKNHELINEQNEKLQFKDIGNSPSLQEYAIEEYETILYQQLGIMLTLDKKFEKLDGFIEIVFEIPNGNKKEIRIPVDISIQDTLE
ncbi:hypothetical protein [Sphingobacterium wenxiniae]|uniref:Uncharacterized protein n=1 Tax=Sphingobacterium wenxiniae TaxID=683125 RepID=A0A1I6Q955_9SPHI|nr:hypothetical protein [Sphingobacterium wenxiniae]SFS48830.1 hypothetical protein SAMN05660206_102195 [Sphingobacterium wenxiniae]